MPFRRDGSADVRDRELQRARPDGLINIPAPDTPVSSTSVDEGPTPGYPRRATLAAGQAKGLHLIEVGWVSIIMFLSFIAGLQGVAKGDPDASCKPNRYSSHREQIKGVPAALDRSRSL